ncbi:unnamed protein product [Dibothriocephalus latus]|uniref:Bestrophin homolog n=1 Tax=Dibothriocephalus latus TaxID=60516 RepID=A0A3P7LTQ1_DIBLA|nr:unnamed protein product [Dibothriocephalus latus]
MMTQEELELYRASVEDCSFGVYFLPLVWAEDLVDKMYQEKSINHKRKVECLIQELLAGRLALATLYTYDMLKVPLVYTQVGQCSL